MKSKSLTYEFDEYKKWLLKEQKIDIKKENYYYQNVRISIKNKIENSKFWEDISNNLKEFDAEYRILTDGFDLFLNDETPEILIKPFDSFLIKTYRINVLENSDWPKSPKSGWTLPINWFSSIKDIIRTSFIVKYIDGVEFLYNRIKKISEDSKCNCEADFEAREEGYYALHVNVKKEIEIPDRYWDTKKIDFNFEIQITTQIQDLIKKMLHKYYEKYRLKATDLKWKWKYDSDEFETNYLGHTLHYLEGAIYKIRKYKGGV